MKIRSRAYGLTSLRETPAYGGELDGYVTAQVPFLFFAALWAASKKPPPMAVVVYYFCNGGKHARHKTLFLESSRKDPFHRG